MATYEYVFRLTFAAHRQEIEHVLS